MAKEKKVTVTPDSRNLNKHTEYGMSLLEKSMRKFGFVEAGVISEDNVICGGNARNEVAEQIGIEDKQIIEIDGKSQVYLKVKGLKSGTKEFAELGIALNAVPKENIEWDVPVMFEVIKEFDFKPLDWGIHISEETEVDLSGFSKGAESYLNNSIRQIVLYFDIDTHKQVLERLDACGKRFDIEDDSSAVVLKLLELYEGKYKEN